MTTPDGTEAYFNKRTSTISKTRPVEMDALAASSTSSPSSSSSGKKGVGKDDGLRHELVLDNTKTFDIGSYAVCLPTHPLTRPPTHPHPPTYPRNPTHPPTLPPETQQQTAITWLEYEYKKADFDKNGTLSWQEFSAFVHSLRLGLGEKEIEQFCRLADANGDGVVEWVEVLELTPLILKKLYASIPPGPHDWCMIVGVEGRAFYLNKRTGLVVTSRPPDYVEEEEAEEEDKTGEEEEEDKTGEDKQQK